MIKREILVKGKSVPGPLPIVRRQRRPCEKVRKKPGDWLQKAWLGLNRLDCPESPSLRSPLPISAIYTLFSGS